MAYQVATQRPDLVRRLVLEDVELLKPRPTNPPAQSDGPLALDWQVIEQVRPEIDNFAPTWTDVVAAIEVPTLVIAGGATSPVPHEQITDLVRHLPEEQMVTIEAGHLVRASKPAEFTSRLRSFLSSPNRQQRRRSPASLSLRKSRSALPVAGWST